LRVLLAQVPHHPRVLTELGRTLAMLSDWTALERLAREERASQKDSILLGRELALAQERLVHPTDAALTAVQVWAASPAEADWALGTLERLPNVDPRAVRDALRRATQREPLRADLARGMARLEWRAGDTAAMVSTLAAADHAGGRANVRWSFADELLLGNVAQPFASQPFASQPFAREPFASQPFASPSSPRPKAPRDSTAALEVLENVAADRTLAAPYRFGAARRAWDVHQASGSAAAGAVAIARALSDVPGDQWDAAFALEIARGLRASGHTAEARALLDAGEAGGAGADIALERALTDLRDGPPERALPALRAAAARSPEGSFAYAEALFFAGQCDSARVWYERVTSGPPGPSTGAALERMFLIEDADPKSALPAFARASYAAWRGDTRAAAAIAESLYRALPHRTLWAEAALLLGQQRDAAGEPRAALEPLLAVADSLPDDRLAPLARQRAGDIYRDRLRDDARAADQYEACLTRYPRAWNAPEVRRALERLRRERRL
jgi:hypothetical protein